MDLTEKLLKMKEKVEKAKISKAQAKGRLEQLMSGLAEKHGCKTLKSAETKLKKLDATIAKAKKELEEGIEELEEAYDFD